MLMISIVCLFKGSDLDGDEYEVLFLKDFLFPRENYEAMDYAVPKNDTGKTQENTSIQVSSLSFMYQNTPESIY